MYIHAWVTRAVIIVLKRIDDDDGRNEMRRASVREAMMAAIENDGVEFGRCPAPHPALDSYGCFHVPLKLLPLFSSVPQLKPYQ